MRHSRERMPWRARTFSGKSSRRQAFVATIEAPGKSRASRCRNATASRPFSRCLTDRLMGAIDDLVGPERWTEHGDRNVPWGWWQINFSQGADQPWDVPTDWHWDGMKRIRSTRHNRVCSSSACSRKCNRAAAARSSPGVASTRRPVSRATSRRAGQQDALDRFPRRTPGSANCTAWTKISPLHRAARTVRRMRYFMDQTVVDEQGTALRYRTTALPGDAYLCHPFMYHSASQNHVRPGPIHDQSHRTAGGNDEVRPARRRLFGARRKHPPGNRPRTGRSAIIGAFPFSSGVKCAEAWPSLPRKAGIQRSAATIGTPNDWIPAGTGMTAKAFSDR